MRVKMALKRRTPDDICDTWLLTPNYLAANIAIGGQRGTPWAQLASRTPPHHTPHMLSAKLCAKLYVCLSKDMCYETLLRALSNYLEDYAADRLSFYARLHPSSK